MTDLHGWADALLGNCATFIRGVSYKKEQARDTPAPGYVPILRAGNLQSGRVVWDDLVYVPRSCVSAEQLLAEGDIVVAMSSGSASVVGKASTVTRDDASRGGSFGAFCGLWRPVQSDLGKWTAAFFQTATYRRAVSAAALGVNINNLRASHIAGLRIAIPPVAEQKRIVAKVEELTARSRRAKEALAAVPPLLDQLRQSILAAAFRGDLTADWRAKNPNVEPAAQLLARIRAERRACWEATELAKLAAKGKRPTDNRWKERYQEPASVDISHLPDLPRAWAWACWREIGTSQNGRPFPSSQYQTTGIRLLRPGNLHASGSVRWTPENTRCLPAAFADANPDLLVGPGELIMNLTAQSLKDQFLGRVCVTGPGERSLLNQRLARLTPIGLSPRFVLWMLRSPLVRAYIDELNSGSLIQHMFTSQVDTFSLPIPPAAEQAQIVDQLDKAFGRIDTTDSLIRNEAQRASSLDAAILAKAFRGELVPQDPNEEPASVLLERLRTARAAAEFRGSVPRSSPRNVQTGVDQSGDLTDAAADPPQAAANRPSARPSEELPTLGEGTMHDAVFGALWPHGPVEKDIAIRRVADHLRQAGYVDFQRLRANSALYRQLLNAIESALKGGRLDRPKRGSVRACKVDATTYTVEDWRHALLTSLGTTPTDREDAIRAGAEWARDNLGLDFTRLRTDGHIVEGLRSAINSAIRRCEVIRHDATRISRAPRINQ